MLYGKVQILLNNIHVKVLYIPKWSGHHLTYARHFQRFADPALLVCSPDKKVLEGFSDSGFKVRMTDTLNQNIPNLAPYFQGIEGLKVYYSYLGGIEDIKSLFQIKYPSKSLFFMSYLGFSGGIVNIKQIVKYLLVGVLLLANKNVEIGFLEDKRAVKIFRTLFNKQRIHFLLDPVDYNLDAHVAKITIGHFGTLCKRKGSDRFLSLASLNSTSNELYFVMAGKFIDINIPIELPSNFNLIEGYISEKDLAAFIDDSDVLILPYRERRGSSGMIINALSKGKLVIGPYYGLVGQIGRQSIYYIPVKGDSIISYNTALQKTIQSLRLGATRTPERFVTDFLQ